MLREPHIVTTGRIFFDDLSVSHTKNSPIIQQDDYYPFGLTFNSWQRQGGVKNKYKFNAGSEENEFTGNYETWFRPFDPAIGRFQQLDELADFVSGITPYQYGFNNPILFNDPHGLFPEDGDDERIIPFDRDSQVISDLIIPQPDGSVIVIETDGPDMIWLNGQWHYFGPDGTWKNVWSMDEVIYFGNTAQFYYAQHGNNLLDDNYFFKRWNNANEQQRSDLFLARHYANGQNYLISVGVAVGIPVATITIAEVAPAQITSAIYNQIRSYTTKQIQQYLKKKLEKKILQRLEKLVEERLRNQRAIKWLEKNGLDTSKELKNISQIDKLMKIIIRDYFKL